MRRSVVAVVMVATVLVGTMAPVASEEAPNQQVKIVFAGGHYGVATATGPINAVGVAIEESTINPDQSFFGTLTFVFPLGQISAPFTGHITEVVVDPTTCVGRFRTTGTFDIAGGTGWYRGVSGSGSFSERGTFNALPTSSGCSPQPLVRTLLVTEATATITLPASMPSLGSVLNG